jgi:adenylate cyclase
MHGDEDATMATLSARRAVVDELIAKHRVGSRTPPGIACSPNSPASSMRLAARSRSKRRLKGRTKASRMRFRIGVNVGDVMAKEGDIFGDGVNVAARLEGLVKGDEICVSRGVHDHLRHRGGMMFEDLGEQLVKNIAHPIRAFRLRIGEAASGQDVTVPEATAETLELPSAPAVISELSADNEVAMAAAASNDQ